MGLELRTTAHTGKITDEGRLYLDSNQLTFRGKQIKLEVDLKPLPQASVSRGQLQVKCGRDIYRFDVGDAADRWLDKILHPPNRLKKLAVKPEMKCWISRGFDSEFRDEIRIACRGLTRDAARCDLAFLLLSDRDELGRLVEICDQLAEGVNVWVVYPKGVPNITQSDVMSTAKKLGFGPSKTTAFDDRLSSMRYARRKS